MDRGRINDGWMVVLMFDERRSFCGRDSSQLCVPPQQLICDWLAENAAGVGDAA